jgi:hypothetical protein
MGRYFTGLEWGLRLRQCSTVCVSGVVSGEHLVLLM